LKTKNEVLFAQTPVPKAVITLVIPTIISQIITVIYNMADTFFIGQMNDPNQVAAATLIMPPFVLLTGIANLFGIGGASLLSRSLGAGDREKASRCAGFSIRWAFVVSLLYGLLIFALRSVLFPLLGSDAYTYKYCCDYALWVLAVGSVPTVLSACLAHLVRAEGCAKEAAFGIAMGGILNMLLDPLLMFALHMGVTGAAVATMLSNMAALVYYILLIRKRRGQSVIRLSLRGGSGVAREILLVGFPSFVMTLMGTFSNTILNKMVVSYSNQAIAGMGIAKKIDMLAFAIATGMTQGVLPLIGYNFAAKNFRRMRSVIKTAFLYTVTLALLGTLFLTICAVPVVRFFIGDAATVAYGQHFLRIIALSCPAIAVTMMVICIFQATGQKKRPMVLSLLRKGGLDVPFMFLMNGLVGANGIPWATPMADALSMLTAICLFLPTWRQLREKEKETERLQAAPESEGI